MAILYENDDWLIEDAGDRGVRVERKDQAALTLATAELPDLVQALVLSGLTAGVGATLSNAAVADYRATAEEIASTIAEVFEDALERVLSSRQAEKDDRASPPAADPAGASDDGATESSDGDHARTGHKGRMATR